MTAHVFRRGILRGFAAAALGAALGGIAPARAGPAEARARWKEAEASRNAPWNERVVAYRLVRRESGDADPIRGRAAAAEARLLRDGDETAAAAAAEVLAASGGAPRDDDPLGHALAAARAAYGDGDGVAGGDAAADVVLHGGGAAVTPTGAALVLLARAAADADDVAAVASLARRAEREVPNAFVERLQILDVLGLAWLRRGDETRARHTLAEQKRVLESARAGGDAAETSAAKAWRRLALPRALE